MTILRHFTPRQWGFWVLAALSGVGVSQLCFIEGLARTSAAHNGLIAVGFGGLIIMMGLYLTEKDRAVAGPEMQKVRIHVRPPQVRPTAVPAEVPVQIPWVRLKNIE